MPGQSQKAAAERSSIMRQDTTIMLKLAEILLRNQLISPEEKFRLTQLIRKEHAI